MPILDNLGALRAALAAMTDTERAALHVAADTITVTPSTSGVMAAIAHAADWELHRRRGIDFALLGAQNAIGPEDLATSLTALVVFGALFRAQPRVQALLDAIAEELQAPPPTLQ